MAMLDDEMVATYGVEIVGVDRTRSEMAKLTHEIEMLRKAKYQSGTSVTVAAFGTDASSRIGRGDIFKTKMDQLEGRVQTGATKAMAQAVSLGHAAQAGALERAVTAKGLSGKPAGRRGPGRNVTGKMIRQIKHNVETYKSPNSTLITGWHGWPKEDREARYAFQELGTKGRASAQLAGSVKRRVKARRKGAKGGGIAAANSLGAAIIITREALKKELSKL